LEDLGAEDDDNVERGCESCDFGALGMESAGHHCWNQNSASFLIFCLQRASFFPPLKVLQFFYFLFKKKRDG
jgi:hypothetical protein